LSALALLLVAAACGTNGEERDGSSSPRPRDQTPWDDLSTKAKQDGTVPLIVTLDVEIQPEGYLQAKERTAQRARIAETRKLLLAELAGTGYDNVKGFDVVPVVALDASSAAVEALRRSQLVAHVEEDVAVGAGGASS
jgi:hypothetical protein